MRGVDLTPPEERHGSSAPTRTGGLHYIVLVALGLGLLAVVVTTFTSKQVSDGKADVARLEQELTQSTATATALQPFADFRKVQVARSATVTSLAQSRFDWERVMNELALVLPDDIWLVNLTGTVLPDVQIEGGGGVSTRDSVRGPSARVGRLCSEPGCRGRFRRRAGGHRRCHPSGARQLRAARDRGRIRRPS